MLRLKAKELSEDSSKLPVGGMRNGNDATRSACERKQHWHSDYLPT